MTEPLVIYIQDESRNPYGTYKDRRSRHIVGLAKEEGISTRCLITSGNAGYSLGRFAAPEGIRVVAVVDRALKSAIKEQLRDACEVIEYELNDTIFKPEALIA